MCLRWLLCKQCCSDDPGGYDPEEERRRLENGRLDYIAANGAGPPPPGGQKAASMNELRASVNKKVADDLARQNAKPPKQLTPEEKEDQARMERVSKMSMRDYDQQERERCLLRLTNALVAHWNSHNRYDKRTGAHYRPEAEKLMQENRLLTETLAFKKIFRDKSIDIGAEQQQSLESCLLPGMRKKQRFNQAFASSNSAFML